MAPIPVRKDVESGDTSCTQQGKNNAGKRSEFRIISYLCTAISLNTLLYMQKNHLLMAIVIAFVCSLGLASCETDDDDSS